MGSGLGFGAGKIFFGVGVEGTRSVCNVVGVGLRSRLHGVGVGVVLGSVLEWCSGAREK